MSIHNRDFEDYLCGASSVNEAYARLGKTCVPSELDREVLALAAAAVRRPQRSRFARLAPFALAASVLVGLVMLIYLVRISAYQAPSRDVPKIVRARATAQDRLTPRADSGAPAADAAEGPIELVPPILNRHRIISSDPVGSRPLDLDGAKPSFYKDVPADELPSEARQDLANLEALRRDGQDAPADAAERAFREKYPDIALMRK
jgi:hypothetical protein